MEIAEKIKNFLFYKNLWALDFITIIGFATYVGYKVNRDSIYPNKAHWDKILLEVSTYILTFVIALILQKKIAWMKSWFWLAIVGALMRILILQTIHFPSNWAHRQEFSPSFSVAVSRTVYDLFVGTGFNWVSFAIAGLICIFAVRFFAYPFWNIYIAYNKHKSGFPKT